MRLGANGRSRIATLQARELPRVRAGVRVARCQGRVSVFHWQAA